MTAEQPKNENVDRHEQSQDLTLWIAEVNKILTDPPFDEPELPCEILPWLFLSSQRACTYEVLEEMEVTHVLTLNALAHEKANQQYWSYREIGVDQTYVPSYDCEGYDMIGQHWKSTCRPVLENVKKTPNGKIVVHCVAGQNRSGLIVAAALLELERWPLSKVVRHLKTTRGIVLTNVSFQRQLCELAQGQGLLGDPPTG